MGRRGNGEGSITRRKDGLYMARYWVETPAGKKRRTIYGKKGEKRQDLADRLAEALRDRSRGLVFEGDDRTLSAFLDGWLAGTVKGSVKSTTYESYERVIRCHVKPELGRRQARRRIRSGSFTPSSRPRRRPGRTPKGLSPWTLNRPAVSWRKPEGSAWRPCT